MADQGDKTKAAVYFRWTSASPQPGNNAAVKIGALDITWFVRFRGMKSDY
jgi:hypothetical protein